MSIARTPATWCRRAAGAAMRARLAALPLMLHLLLLPACIEPRGAPDAHSDPARADAPRTEQGAMATPAPLPATVPAGTQWIWSDLQATDAPGASPAHAWFTASFNLDTPPAVAQLGLSADNHATVWLNGTRIAHTDEWTEPLVADVAADLVAGRNVLAIEAANDGGPAGLLAFVLADGADVFHTDAAMLASDTEPAGFPNEPMSRAADAPADPADSAGGASAAATNDGRPAAVIADYGAAPWGTLDFGGKHAPAPVVRQLAPAAGLLCEEVASGFGSLIAFSMDSHGVPVVSVESGGLLALHDDDGDGRYERSSLFCDELRACQGLCFTGEDCWATGIGPEGLGFYRLRADATPRHAELIAPITGSAGEHGPHAVLPGPDGRLWLTLGNHVRLGVPAESSSPFSLVTEGSVLPRIVDPNGHANEITAPGGTIFAFDPASGRFELFSAGYRNAYDLAFTPSGDLFTFDSDMEWDIGLPWYRAVRVVHVLPGGDYGWRTGSGKWPAWYPDSLPPVLDTGRGSPTGVLWCGSSALGPRWQDTLLLCDWSQGEVLAVHLSPDGISYRGRSEVLLSGRPLPVTDLAFERDGALLVSVGGRGTQGALMRLRADPAAADARAARASDVVAAARAQDFVAAARAPAFTSATPLDTLADALESPDRAVRYLAARALEHRPTADVERVASVDPRPAVRAEALVALARQALRDGEAAAMLASRCRALALPLLAPEVPTPVRLVAARALELSLLVGLPDTIAGSGQPADPVLGAALLPLFPSGAPALDRALAALLARTEPDGAREALLAALDEEDAPEEAAHLLLCLSSLRAGMSADDAGSGTHRSADAAQTRAALERLAALRSRPGGASYQGFLDAIERRLIDAAPADERDELRASAHAGNPAADGAATIRIARNAPRRDQERTLAFARNALDAPDRSLTEGAWVFAQSCAACHVRGGIGRAGGPDLSSVGARLGLADLLTATMDPSRDISDQYRSTQLFTKDGRLVQGLLLRDDGAAVQLLTSTGETVSVAAADIDERRLSRASAMPEGLLDGWSLRAIADLSAYLLAPEAVAPPARSAWEPLFADGLRGWRGDLATWSVSDGVLLGERPVATSGALPDATAAPQAPQAVLTSPFVLGDFSFECEVLLPAGSGGIAVHCVEAMADTGAMASAGAQLDAPLPSTLSGKPPGAIPAGDVVAIGGEAWGSLTDERTGAHVASDRALWRPELALAGWNHLLIEARGAHLRVVLNGVETAAFTEAATTPGALAFRLSDVSAPAAFRLISLRRD